VTGRVSTNGVTLHVRDRGEGTPVVFLHGVMCSSRLFERQVDRFSAEHRAVAPDFRGHGESDRPLSGHTVPSYARDLRGLFEAIDVDRPVLVGWSMGAMVAYEYLSEYGQDGVAGLVIVDQPPADFAWGSGYEFGLFTPEEILHATEGIQTDLPGLADGWAELMLHDPTLETKGVLIEELTKVPPAIGSSILVDQTLRDYRTFLPSLRVPTLVAFGADDKATDPAAGRWIAEAVPGARLEIFDRSSHCPFLEEPDAFNHALASFLKEL
jgi:non-heme chloroperoxidase